MKKCIILCLVLATAMNSVGQDKIKGAWESRTSDGIITLIIADNYLVSTRYDIDAKKFYGTHGGTIKIFNGAEISGVTEFNSVKKEEVGKEYKLDVKMVGNTMAATHNGSTVVFTRVDDGTKNMTGNWRITQREQNGQLTPIHTSGPRKTIKILSSTRFQWAAINTETGEFSGTGGGRYTFENGMYTEHIEFFSRDSSRVGMSLSFNGKLDKNDWYHSGKSSKGDPINEVWSRK
ncbi:MAG TPA: hypothetical protein VFX73_08620 [Chitinophagaceae bacterium]|nr:hypothetical protein [Chitinophagaceae bacterium]